MFKQEVKSFGYAIKGFLAACKTETHLKFHVLAAVMVTALGFYVKLNAIEWCIIVLCIASVIAAELFNTAIEKVVDLVSPNYHKTAGFIKDVSAAAVLVLSVAAAIVGCIIFINKLG
jgi:diacylglycerol kinase (ATP)